MALLVTVLRIGALALVAGLLGAAFGYGHVTALDPALVDNGDGGRLIWPAHWEQAGEHRWQPTAEIPMIPAAEPMRTPRFVSAIPVWLLALAHRAAGLEVFQAWTLVGLYYAVFLGGLGALVWMLRSTPARVAVGLAGAVLLASAAHRGLFFSVYEEGFALALAPLFVAAVIGPARLPFLVLAGTAAAFVTGKTYLALFVPVAALAAVAGARPLWLKGAGLALVLGAVATTIAIRPAEHAAPNAANRVFAGLALAMNGIAGWEERTWGARTVALRGGEVDLARRIALPEDLRPFWGESYWPDLVELPDPLHARLVSIGSWGTYVSILRDDPEIARDLVREASLTAVRADFALCYLRADRCAPEPLGRSISGAMGLAFALAPLLALLAIGRGRWRLALLFASVAAAPTGVAMADGFYEYEKHLILFPAVAILAAPALLAPKPAAD